MKKRFILGLSFSAILIVSLLAVAVSVKNENIKKAEGYSAASLPTTIDLNDTSAANIRSYYSSLNNLSQSERQGTNLLKNLKTILKNGQKYFSYENGENIWKMYEITDRDWVKSPASAITNGTYNANTNKITGYTYNTTNPYVRAIYINRNVENQTTAWSDHQQTQWGINREHLWPKAEGFDSKGAGGARGDPFHLVAANGYANNIHSNYYYGYVNKSSTYTDCGSTYSNLSGNLRGKSKTLGGSTSVFEPQDSDKGDIARSIFYMVARYNYLSGSDSDGIDANNPNLTLTQSLSDWASSGYTSSASQQGKLGILTDLLAWHHADPVDEIEIHRNNLLYTNFTNNRNPFIDFPEWADFIWGTATYNGSTYQSYNSTPTGYAKPSSDTLNGYNSGSTDPVVNYVTVSPSSVTIDLTGTKTRQLTATVNVSHGAAQTVTWSTSNSSVATVSSSGLVTGKAAGTTTITATSTADLTKSDVCTVTVLSGTVSVTGVALNSDSESLTVGGSTTLTATVSPNNATNKNISWTTSDDTVAEVNEGVITAVGVGTATITVITEDGDFTDTCTVTVSAPSSTDFALYSGTITEGDYVIYYSGKAMKNVVSSGRLDYLEVSPTNSKISSPDSSIVWHIEKSGSYWTIYNSAVNKYAASTGANNKAQLLTDGNNDMSLWTCTGTSTYEFVNKKNAADSVNSNLRNNGTYGFACYSTSTGDALSLYKRQAASVAVTGVSLDQDNVSIDVGDNETLVATIEPENATNTNVTWESSNEDVVTVVDGTLTAVGPGLATITVSTEDGGFTATCQILASEAHGNYSLTSGSPYINGIAYKMYFYSTSKSDTYYFTGEMDSDTIYYGASSTSISDAADVYFEENSSGTGQNIKLSNNNYIYIAKNISGNKTHYNFKCDGTVEPSSPWIYDNNNSALTFSIENADYSIGSRSTFETWGAYTLANTEYKVQFVATDSDGDKAFATVLNDNISCNALGTAAPSFDAHGNFTWALFKKAYESLDSTNQNSLKNSEADEYGTEIQRFVARYDYIVGKYGESVYDNFIGRNITPIGNGALTDVVTELTSSNLTIIVTCGIMGGLLALGAYVLIKKKKED